MKCRECPRTVSGVSSIYCSSRCIGIHVRRAKEVIKRLKRDNGSAEVVVKNDSTGVVLREPKGPGIEELGRWLENRPTFYVDLPEIPTRQTPHRLCRGARQAVNTEVSRNDLSGSFQEEQSSLPPNPKRRGEETKVTMRTKPRDHVHDLMSSKRNEVQSKFAKGEKPCPPSHEPASKKSKTDRMEKEVGLNTKSSKRGNDSLKRTKKDENDENAKTSLKKNLSLSSQNSSSGSSSKLQKSTRSERPTILLKDNEKRNPGKTQVPTVISKEVSSSERSKVQENLMNALSDKLYKHGDVEISHDDMKELCKSIEEELFRVYCKSKHKYLNQYRIILMNIMNNKSKLYLSILKAVISPSDLVQMKSVDMAPEHLKDWRNSSHQFELNNIEKYSRMAKTTPAALVIKTHKEEIRIEPRDSGLSSDFVIDEVPTHKVISTTETHGKHAYSKNCEVCTGKMTLEEFIDSMAEKIASAKILANQNTAGEKPSIVLPNPYVSLTRLPENSTLGPLLNVCNGKIWNESRSGRPNWPTQIETVDERNFSAVAELVSGHSFFPELNSEGLFVWKTELMNLLQEKITNHRKRDLEILVVRFWPKDHPSSHQSLLFLEVLRTNNTFGEVEERCSELFSGIYLLPAREMVETVGSFFDKDVVQIIENGHDLLIGLLLAKKSYRSRSNPDEIIQIDSD